jgi:microcystin degradation protein MlrC
MGYTVWVSADGTDLVLNSVRTQVFNLDAMTGLDLDPRTRMIVIVKSTQNLYAAFAPIAREILYVTAPGTIAPDSANIPPTKLARALWPRAPDPF